jgi:rare lipoprotein A
MRAKLTLGATGAKKTGARTTGALSLTLVIAAIVLGTVAAGALAAQSGAASAPGTSTTAGIRTAHRSGQLRFSITRSRLVVERDLFAGPVGRVVVVHGLLKPVRRGATVKLMTRSGHHWRTLATGRTRRNGRFGIRYRVRGEGASWIRVRFSGNRRLRAVSASAGRIVSLAPTVASWYDDAGNTACGFHATYGVANKTLPCGTKVTLSYGGHTVVATVDDRGPYVYGRSFDLNQNTARYLGMWGVGTIFASV